MCNVYIYIYMHTKKQLQTFLVASPAPYLWSPHKGWPIEAKWTRIWWVRPGAFVGRSSMSGKLCPTDRNMSYVLYKYIFVILCVCLGISIFRYPSWIGHIFGKSAPVVVFTRSSASCHLQGASPQTPLETRKDVLERKCWDQWWTDPSVITWVYPIFTSSDHHEFSLFGGVGIYPS